ncbi:putative F-box protein At1g65770 [Rutidosis leptorrhynchoides]|uniref:putative F-box protein At1g65770 n=1 Tax=Rutidosis leptorrhynchoides TaxID=125765 RepID=UPI003A9943B1
MNLPETLGRKCRSVGYGWLFTVDVDLQLNLLNPLTRHQINLPSYMELRTGVQLHEKRNAYIDKVIASTDPWNSQAQHYNQDCVIMTISGIASGLLAFARPGDEAWTLYVCDIDGEQHPNGTPIARVPKWVRMKCGDRRKYIVESCGELFFIQRYFYDRDEEPFKTKYFYVLKLKEAKKKKGPYKYKLVKVKTLGNRAIFIGDNASFSFLASSINGCKANHIYFTDDTPMVYLHDEDLAGSDMGVYNFKKGTIERHYETESLSHFCTSLWVI